MDVVLVGDSLGMVIQGHDTTVPVTMDQMVYHCAAVARGLDRPFLIADLPFMSYPSQSLALEHSVRLMQEGGAEMVKLESGGKQTEIVEFLASHDIAVCTHLRRKPRFVRNFMEGAHNNLEALQNYVRAVKRGEYPAPEHCF